MSPGTPTFSSPERLGPDHDLSQFACGEPSLDDWLRHHALQNEESRASRTYVVCQDKRVVAYHALAVGAVSHSSAPGRVRRNMPDPVPVMIIARLAVDRLFQSFGHGQGLLRDAVLRTLQASSIAGIRVILVHAISEQARVFYENHGFITSPMDPLTLMITLREAERELTNK
jgi:GNAT superfamily N-acetyltransferase